MEVQQIKDSFLLSNRFDLIKLNFYINLLHKGITPYDSDLNILTELYLQQGYSNKEEQELFFQKCYAKKYKKEGISKGQALRNTLSIYTDYGVLEKPKNNQRYVKSDFFPYIKEGNGIVLNYIIGNINAKKS